MNTELKVPHFHEFTEYLNKCICENDARRDTVVADRYRNAKAIASEFYYSYMKKQQSENNPPKQEN